MKFLSLFYSPARSLSMGPVDRNAGQRFDWRF